MVSPIEDICLMHRAYLLLGSNQGDRINFLVKAMEALGQLGKLSARSAVYETAAWGKSDQPPFLNQAVELETALSPEALLTSTLQIEKKLGRERLERYGPRTIDIDILLFNDLMHESPTLKIPHPELINRRFALTALAEIAGDRIHPFLNKKIGLLLIQCPDPLLVKRID